MKQQQRLQHGASSCSNSRDAGGVLYVRRQRPATNPYFDLRLDFFGFASRQHLYVAGDLFASARLSRAQLDVPSYQLIATCKPR